jgi:hypothetical protein
MQYKLFLFLLLIGVLAFASISQGDELPWAGVQDIIVNYSDAPEGWRIYEVSGPGAWRIFKKCRANWTNQGESCQFFLYPEYKWVIILALEV